MQEALIAFAVMLGLTFLRLPIAFSMALVGFLGFAYMVNFTAAFSMVGSVAFETGMSYTLSIVPLFILMGNLVTRAGLSAELYRVSYAFLGHRRGGLAMATILACGGFGAVCGSSLATAATMSKVAMPSMRKYGYSDALAAGSIAAGGTLGILIPPSVVMVIYGILTEQNIGKLFIAGILPGIVAVACYLAAVAVTVRLDAKAGPRGERVSWHERLVALGDVWGVLRPSCAAIGHSRRSPTSSCEAPARNAGCDTVTVAPETPRSEAGMVAKTVSSAAQYKVTFPTPARTGSLRVRARVPARGTSVASRRAACMAVWRAALSASVLRGRR